MESFYNQSTDLADREREKESVYDEVKPNNCAETAIFSEVQHCIHYCETQFSFVMINFISM